MSGQVLLFTVPKRGLKLLSLGDSGNIGAVIIGTITSGSFNNSISCEDNAYWEIQESANGINVLFSFHLQGGGKGKKVKIKGHRDGNVSESNNMLIQAWNGTSWITLDEIVYNELDDTYTVILNSEYTINEKVQIRIYRATGNNQKLYLNCILLFATTSSAKAPENVLIDDNNDSLIDDSFNEYLIDGLIPAPSVSIPTSSNAENFLTTPTSDGSDEAIHPGVVDMYASKGVGQSWNGYRYWMAMTPFPEGDVSLENPEILASNDGDTWVVPAGLTNPIDNIPSGTHHADTDLILGQDDVLYCFYIDVNESTPDTVHMKVMSSSDGISWGGETTIFTINTDNGACPSVIWDGSQYVMWYVDYSHVVYSVRRRVSSSLDSGWGEEIGCTLFNKPSEHEVWNIHIVKNGNDYHAVFGMLDDPKPIYFASSEDGINWTIESSPLLEVGESGSWDDGFLYRACIVPIENGYDMWYSANNQLGTWDAPHIGKTTINL